MMFRIYDVSRTGYQSWRTRGESKRSERDRELLGVIERVYGAVDGLYGSPKVTEHYDKKAWSSVRTGWPG